MQKLTPLVTRRLLAGTTLAGLALNAVAGTDTAAAPASQSAGQSSSFLAWQLKKPSWLTDLSVGFREMYDDNVLMVSGDGPLKPKSSLVSVVTGKVGFNFAPLLGNQTAFQLVGLSYVPEFDIYHNSPDETFNAHRLTESVKGKVGSISFNAENTFGYVDGNDLAPIYPGNDRLRSSFATVAAKEQVKQIQELAKVVLQYDADAYFIRPTASLVYNDMLTDFSSTVGYQNYPSRYDLNGGADFGYRISSNVALTLGGRYGHQYQQKMPASIDSNEFASDNDYERVLVGVEGKPWKWLTVAAQVGPDFRQYASTAGVSDRNQITYYGEGTATANITANDSLAFKYKTWQWLACTGRLPYFDSNYQLTYHRKLTNKLSFDLTGRFAEYDFTPGGDPKSTNLRDDYLYSLAPAVTYSFTPNFSVTASGTIDFGRNAQDNAPGGGQFREFDHNVASLSIGYKF